MCLSVDDVANKLPAIGDDGKLHNGIALAWGAGIVMKKDRHPLDPILGLGIKERQRRIAVFGRERRDPGIVDLLWTQDDGSRSRQGRGGRTRLGGTCNTACQPEDHAHGVPYPAPVLLLDDQPMIG